jgi:branched-chain amino acid transport system ATP-binding protein
MWVNGGEIVALLGRNGAGKSTLLKICAGLMRCDHGHLDFRGKRVERPRFHTLARRGLSYLPGERNLFSSSFPLGQQFRAMARHTGSERVEEVIDLLELGGCLQQSPRTLSGGEQRRAGVAMTCLLEPVCLLADEPLRGIDPRDQERIMAVYRGMAQTGCAIVVTGHQADYLLDDADAVVWTTAGTTHPMGPPEAAREHWQFRREFLGTVRQ